MLRLFRNACGAVVFAIVLALAVLAVAIHPSDGMAATRSIRGNGGSPALASPGGTALPVPGDPDSPSVGGLVGGGGGAPVGSGLGRKPGVLITPTSANGMGIGGLDGRTLLDTLLAAWRSLALRG